MSTERILIMIAVSALCTFFLRAKSSGLAHNSSPSLLLLLHSVECFDLCLFAVEAALLHGSDDPQHPVVIVGEDFLELGQILAEVVQDLFAARGAGGFHMLADQLLQGGNIVLMLHGFD